MKIRDDEIYFACSATLRIHGMDLPFDEISKRLGSEPTHVHRKSDRTGTHSRPFKSDAWHFQPALPESAKLEMHLHALWKQFKPRARYLRSLKKRYDVDVFCGYRSNCDHAGLDLEHSSLEIFTALEVPFRLSIIVA